VTAFANLHRLTCILLAILAAPSAIAQPQGRLVTGQLQSTGFADNRIGISPVRNVTVYLPPTYAQAGRRFPVLYFLNHFNEDQREPFASHGAKELLDKAIGDGVIGDIIVVTADFSTPAGSSWYVNSPVTGNWEDFLVRELVPHVDATYRTLASRDSRGIVGDGPGGYGAIRFGMRHPEIFGAVYGMEPVGTGHGIQSTWIRPNFDLLARATSLDDLGDDGFSRIFTSIYQAFSPNPNRPPLYFDPPARRVDGTIVIDSAVMARFHRGFALTDLLPDYADNLKSLRGLKFDWGRQDMIADHINGAQDLSRQLAEYGVAHEAEEHGGGFRDRHWGEQGRFYTDVLPFFARHLLFGPPTAVRDRVTAAHGRLREAMIANDPGALAQLYRADATSMPDYQPALYGTAQITAYHRAIGERRRVTGYVPVTTEIFDLGTSILEIGTFTITWSVAGGAVEEERGKYAHIWGVEADRSLRLKTDVRGYFRPLPNPAAFFVAMPNDEAPARAPASADPELERVLRARNDRNAIAVQTYDAETKIADYADDAVIMPFADTNKTGIGEIRPYLIAYTNGGRGVTFDSVRVWNVGFEDFGRYVIEYPKFRVAWRSADASAVVKGGGLRLWRRRPDGSLELLRQIGTHDYR
jgi:S-formylglutathione hydrolase FrmB/ketosteroid isomerase-like protein